MSSSDPHQGGSITDMAVDGTTLPADSGKQRVIPSVPNPQQASGNPDEIDNSADIPRGPGDQGATGEVVTAGGEPMPPSVEKKHGKVAGGNPLAKGDARFDKHTRDNQSHLQAEAHEGSEVRPAPGEENEDQDAIRDRKGA